MTVQKGGWDYFQEGKAGMGDADDNAVTTAAGDPAATVNLDDGLGSDLSAEDHNARVFRVEGQFQKVHITTATTTDVKADAGFLHAVVINGGTAGAVTVYDDTTGGTTTPIAVIAAAAAATPAGTKIYDCVMNNGIQVVTAAATDVTIIYR